MLWQPLDRHARLELCNLDEELLHLSGLRGRQAGHLLVAAHHLCRQLLRPALELRGVARCSAGARPTLGLGGRPRRAKVWQHGGGQGVQAVLQEVQPPVLLDVLVPVAASPVKPLLVVHNFLGDGLELVDLLGCSFVGPCLLFEPAHTRPPLLKQLVLDASRQALLGQLHVRRLVHLGLQLLQGLLGLRRQPCRLLGIQGTVLVLAAGAGEEAVQWWQAFGHAASVNVAGLRAECGDDAALLVAVLVVLLAPERIDFVAQRRYLSISEALVLQSRLLRSLRLSSHHGPVCGVWVAMLAR
mmetsp:Transcript_79994/g.248226  ORF Transcript_79994/g.248226 Transcript_79994/m.248226 type:complete len:299 (-) Transcript_79994:24-920(-)